MINPPSLNRDPGVSVIVPTYNRAQLVTRAIDSAIRAVAGRDEIIVVDDGSSDGTESVLKAYGSRIRYVRTENRGAGSARNLGIDLADREWIAFLDSDDEWMPDHLHLHRAFLARSEVLFSFSNFDVHYDHQPHRPPARMRLVSWTGDRRSWDEIISPGEPYSRYAALTEGRDEFAVYIGNIYHLMLRASYVPAWTSVVKRGLAGESLRFPEDLPTFEDYELYVRLAKKGLAAYLDCSTAINHGHEGARLGGVDHVTKAMTQLRILSRNYGRDVTYLRRHRREFETAVAALSHYRLKELVIRGDTKQARHDMKTIEGVPVTTKILSLFPGAVARAVYKLYSAAATNTDP